MNENTQAQAQAQELAQELTPAAPAAQAAPAVVQDYTISTTGTHAAPAYTSLDVTSTAGRKKLYNITNRPDHNISDFINKPISITDIYVDVNARPNRETGEIEDKPRTVLIDTNGESYIAGVSVGVFNSVREILRIFGEPSTWDEPLTVMPVTVRTPKGNMLALEIV